MGQANLCRLVACFGTVKQHVFIDSYLNSVKKKNYSAPLISDFPTKASSQFEYCIILSIAMLPEGTLQQVGSPTARPVTNPSPPQHEEPKENRCRRGRLKVTGRPCRCRNGGSPTPVLKHQTWSLRSKLS